MSKLPAVQLGLLMDITMVIKKFHKSWVISHVPIFHITQPLGINGL